MIKSTFQIFILIFLTISFVSCSNDKPTTKDDTTKVENEKADVKKVKEVKKEIEPRTFNVSKSADVNYSYGELMNLHDEFMSYSGKLKNATLKVEDAKDSVERLGNKKGIKLSSKILSKLNNADERMMDWMHNLKTDFTGMNEKNALIYIEKEKTSIASIGKEMADALSFARKNFQNIYKK